MLLFTLCITIILIFHQASPIHVLTQFHFILLLFCVSNKCEYILLSWIGGFEMKGMIRSIINFTTYYRFNIQTLQIVM